MNRTTGPTRVSVPGPVDHSLRVVALDPDPGCHGNLWLRAGAELLARRARRHQGDVGGDGGDHRGAAHAAGRGL